VLVHAHNAGVQRRAAGQVLAACTSAAALTKHLPAVQHGCGLSVRLDREISLAWASGIRGLPVPLWLSLAPTRNELHCCDGRVETVVCLKLNMLCGLSRNVHEQRVEPFR
jgi:hypothetical protein